MLRSIGDDLAAVMSAAMLAVSYRSGWAVLSSPGPAAKLCSLQRFETLNERALDLARFVRGKPRWPDKVVVY